MAEKEKPKSTISRRTFLGTVGATAVVGVAAGAAIGYLASPRTPDHLVLKIPSSWDHQTDVVVVGAGGAGLSAALGALESGAKVIVLEKGICRGWNDGNLWWGAVDSKQQHIDGGWANRATVTTCAIP